MGRIGRYEERRQHIVNCFLEKEDIAEVAKNKEKRERIIHWTGYFYAGKEGDGANKCRIDESLFVINQFWCTFVEQIYYYRNWEAILQDYDGIIQELRRLYGMNTVMEFGEFDQLYDRERDIHKVEKLKFYHFCVNCMWSNLRKKIEDKELASLALMYSDVIRDLCFYFVKFHCKEV